MTIHDEVETAAEEIQRRKADGEYRLRPRPIEWEKCFGTHTAIVCGLLLEVAGNSRGFTVALNGRWGPTTFPTLAAAKAAAVAGLRTLAKDILAATEGER